MDSGFDHATQPRTLAQKPPLWLLVLILGSGTVGITIISPTLKAIAEDFRVEDSLTQWLLSGYFIAVAFSQLVYGPLLRPLRTEGSVAHRTCSLRYRGGPQGRWPQAWSG